MADESYTDIDYSLNSCSKMFVQKLLGENATYEIKTIEAGNQWNNIVVWVLINEEQFLVIEDKKGSKEQSDQLKRYTEIAKNHFKNSNIKVKLVNL